MSAPRDRQKRCACGHGRDVHDHHRDGSDCGRCGRAGCPLYRPVGRASALVIVGSVGLTGM